METKHRNALIIAGSRDFDDYELLSQSIEECYPGFDPSNTLIIVGGARGADSLGEKYATDHGFTYELFMANWKCYGEQAGVLRNAEMSRRCNEHVNPHLLVFWDGASPGSKAMIDIFDRTKGQKIVIPFESEYSDVT